MSFTWRVKKKIQKTLKKKRILCQMRPVFFVYPIAPFSRPCAPFEKEKKEKKKGKIKFWFLIIIICLCVCVRVCVSWRTVRRQSHPLTIQPNKQKKKEKKTKRETVVIFYLFVFASFAIHLPKFVFIFFSFF